MLRSRSSLALFSIALIAIGLNLRPVLATIGPLLDEMQAQTGLSNTAASLLTTIPVVLMGVCGLLAARLRMWFGVSRGILIGLLAIAAACAARVWNPGSASLVMTAIVAGLGIALVQALLPVLIRQRYASKAGSAMGFYTTAIMGGALIAGVSAPNIAALSNWMVALSVWAVPAMAAVVLWLLLWPQEPISVPSTAQVSSSLLRLPRAWLLMVFFGLGTGAYALVLAWLPPYYTALGWTPAQAGSLLGVVTLSEVMVGLAVSAWIDRLHDRRIALYAAISSLLVALLLLITIPLAAAWPMAVLLGFGIGALFPLSLIVAMDHADSPQRAGEIVAFAQGGGYILAALFPFIAGIVRQQSDDLTDAWLFMALASLAMFAIARRFSPAECHLHPH
ncbi:MFS transporter [Oxalicibacterium faecigallinarum]|uniref:MFS transporter n=1 Tax=Oxalicibacterium faecigallinarum TaxID=573741 RepID=A0A8J3ARG6_9BURK|nr:MFS transporter [Oxalicibacterium faecigallinarum]GGI20756.1 MFS transporter [Oxalicibacterium faecigallinarum]